MSPGRGVEGIDDGVLIEIEEDDLTVVFAELKAIDPEFVVFGMGEPRAGLLLLKVNDRALDGG